MSIMRTDMARQLFLIGGIARPTNVNTTPLPGGIQNLIDTYLSNPTLQSKMSLDDYLGYSNLQTQPTTEEIVQSSVAPTIQTPIVKKPILPIQPESSGDGPPPPPGRKGITAGINFDYGYTGPSMTIDDIGEGTIPDDEYGLRMRLGDAATGIMQAGKEIYSLLSPIEFAKRTKERMGAGLKAAQDYLEEKRKEKERERQRQYEAQIQNAINQGRQMQQSYEDHFSNMGYSSPADRAADTPTGTLGRI